MSNKGTENFVFLFFNLLVIIFTCTAYEIPTLHNGLPCYDNVIYLGSHDKSAFNFSLGNKLINWAGQKNFECNFKVVANSGHSVIAVIQKLNLRGDPIDCLDYVEFQTKSSKMAFLPYSLKRNKKQFCGEKDISNMVATPYESPFNLPENVFMAEQKELGVKVFISAIPVEPDEPTLDIHVVFTATKRLDCKERNEFDCGNHTCIWRGFYKDGLVNCPYKNCSDEEGCEAPTIKYSSGVGTTVIIYAVISILAILLIFSFCLYICRRCKLLCWSGQTCSPVTGDLSSRMSPSQLNESVQPSAPPLISVSDKDLPPSYDSLFPVRDFAVEENAEKNSEDGKEKSVSPVRMSGIMAGVSSVICEGRDRMRWHRNRRFIHGDQSRRRNQDGGSSEDRPNQTEDVGRSEDRPENRPNRGYDRTPNQVTSQQQSQGLSNDSEGLTRVSNQRRPRMWKPKQTRVSNQGQAGTSNDGQARVWNAGRARFWRQKQTRVSNQDQAGTSNLDLELNGRGRPRQRGVTHGSRFFYSQNSNTNRGHSRTTNGRGRGLNRPLSVDRPQNSQQGRKRKRRKKRRGSREIALPDSQNRGQSGRRIRQCIGRGRRWATSSRVLRVNESVRVRRNSESSIRHKWYDDLLYVCCV